MDKRFSKISILERISKLLTKINNQEIFDLADEIIRFHCLDEHLKQLEQILIEHLEKTKQSTKMVNARTTIYN